jgi:Carbohydrate-binding module 48 (Isoamylase N-terminal domain)
LPLGVKWIEEKQAFNFAVHSEHAESVTLLLYSADPVKPVLTFRFDFLHNESGRIWQDQTQHSDPSAQKGFSLRNGPCYYPEQNHPKCRFGDRPQPSRGRWRRYALIRIQESLCIHSRPKPEDSPPSAMTNVQFEIVPSTMSATSR